MVVLGLRGHKVTAGSGPIPKANQDSHIIELHIIRGVYGNLLKMYVIA